MGISVVGDPFSALAEFFTGLIRTGKMVQGFKVVVSVAASVVSSFLTGCGWQLYHEHSSWPVAIGFGMLGAAGSINAMFVLSPLLRGFAIATFKPDPKAQDLSKFEVITREK